MHVRNACKKGVVYKKFYVLLRERAWDHGSQIDTEMAKFLIAYTVNDKDVNDMWMIKTSLTFRLDNGYLTKWHI